MQDHSRPATNPATSVEQAPKDRFPEFPEDIKKIILRLQTAYLALEDLTDASEERIHQFDKKAGENHRKNDPILYQTNAVFILDFFIRKAPQIFHDVFQQVGYVNLSDAYRAYKALDKKDDEVFSPPSEYLDPKTCAPQLLTQDSKGERLFQRMQWFRWALNEILNTKTINDLPYLVKKYVKSYLQKRLNGTNAQLVAYAEKNPNFKVIPLENLEAEALKKLAAQKARAPMEEKAAQSGAVTTATTVATPTLITVAATTLTMAPAPSLDLSLSSSSSQGEGRIRFYDDEDKVEFIVSPDRNERLLPTAAQNSLPSLGTELPLATTLSERQQAFNTLRVVLAAEPNSETKILALQVLEQQGQVLVLNPSPAAAAQLGKDLDKSLDNNPPLSAKARAALFAFIGAVLGFTAGVILGGLITTYAGGFGAFPAALLGAFKGFTLGTAIGLEAATVGAGLGMITARFFQPAPAVVREEKDLQLAPARVASSSG